MNYEFATIIVKLSAVTTLRKLAQALDPDETGGMFATGLSATGDLPATHFISSGQVPDVFAQAIRSPAMLNTQAKAAFLEDGASYPYTLTQVTAALTGCNISDGTLSVLIDGIPTVVSESPHEFIARLGLKMIRAI